MARTDGGAARHSGKRARGGNGAVGGLAGGFELEQSGGGCGMSDARGWNICGSGALDTERVGRASSSRGTVEGLCAGLRCV